MATGFKRYLKQFEKLEWVKGSDLVPKPRSEPSDLLANILQIEGFCQFLEGKLELSSLTDVCAEQAEAAGKTLKGNNKWKGSGKGWRGRDKGDNWNSWGGHKGGWKGRNNNGYMSGCGDTGGWWNNNAYGKVSEFGKGSGYGKGPDFSKGFDYGKFQDYGKGFDFNKGLNYGKGGNFGKNMGMPPMPGSAEAPLEIQRQYYGEQLYVLVQPLAPSPYLAQKIVGMLLELPDEELVLNLTNEHELHRRVNEALDVLRKDGIIK